MEVISLTSDSESDCANNGDAEVEVIPLDESDEEEHGTGSEPKNIYSKAFNVEVEEFAELKSHVEEDVTFLLDIPSVIPRKNPDVGYFVYGQEKSALSKWHMGLVNSIVHNPVFNLVEYDIKFEIKKVKDDNGEKKIQCRSIFRNLPANLMAFHDQTPFKLPVGSRVIAILYNPLENAESNRDNFFVGIIAEPLKPKNNRYLIFFDDGSAQYTSHTDVRLVYASSVKVWEDVYPDTQNFIEDYLKKYPEVPLMSVTKNSRITAEWNGFPWISKVVDIDHSLVKLQFEFSGHSEWIYRGSQRLLKYQSKRVNSQTELVQHASTNGLPYTLETDGIFGEFEKYIPLLCPVNSCIEHEGKMEKLDISLTNPGHNPASLQFPHHCTSRCMPRFNPKDYDAIPPLAIPFYLGFTRVVSDRSVCYKGPCGQKFGNCENLHQFLLQTNSELGIDHFSFERNVRCATKFVPKSIHFKIKDISYGVNKMPVECVNSLGMDMPDYFEYTNDMLPSQEIEINQDVNFLTCCDCIDDCQDQERCSCWQLTFSGHAFKIRNPLLPPPEGYRYRRLYEMVHSGIYECNIGCRKTCLNRVIQNGSARMPLQIFKTSKKGWAIRPLCDVPAGTFICTYGGQVLTESKANEDGKKFGDEYLAAMDYIEVVEHNKCGYESSPDITDSDNDDVVDLNNSVDSEVVRQVCMRKTTLPSTPDNINRQSRKSKRKSTRQFFGKDEQIYIMDAKTIGNIGRYLNHSCEPNVFVQNTFVDSHDIRFPWVSFFASQTIKAGTELTWNYSYEIGSIPGKILYCYCGTPRCKGRLL